VIGSQNGLQSVSKQRREDGAFCSQSKNATKIPFTTLIKKSAPIYVFDLQLFLSLVNIVQSNDMRVVDQLHDGNLALNAPMHRRPVGQRGFGYDLDGYLLICLSMTG